jgi:hypothetical protein
MAQGSTHIWLIDRLAKNFPHFRVWTYGYSPQLHAQSGGEDIHEFADAFTKLLRRLRVDSNVCGSHYVTHDAEVMVLCMPGRHAEITLDLSCS